MHRLPLRYYGDPLLRKKTVPIGKITDSLLAFIDNMIETMLFYSAVGLAAPHVGALHSLFILRLEDGKGGFENPIIYINPKVTILDSKEEMGVEGSVSAPRLRVFISRLLTVRVEALDIEGKPFSEDLSGWKSRVVLHEYDQLQGIFFTDRLDTKEKKKVMPILRKIEREYSRR